VTSKVLNAAIDISRYRIGHTIPNTYPGGFKSDLIRFTYQISNDCDEAKPPIINAKKTNINTEILLLKIKIYLFLKNLEMVLDKSLIKVEPFGLASIKI
jgi:hypothetical protein